MPHLPSSECQLPLFDPSDSQPDTPELPDPGAETPGSWWQDAPLVYAYSRAQALDDGVLVDVSTTAREAGFIWPVAVTQAVWHMITAIPPSKSWQDVDGRLWDVLIMAHYAIQAAPQPDTQLLYRLILHHGRATYATLKLVTGPGDHGEPVVTLMLPDED